MKYNRLEQVRRLKGGVRPLGFRVQVVFSCFSPSFFPFFSFFPFLFPFLAFFPFLLFFSFFFFPFLLFFSFFPFFIFLFLFLSGCSKSDFFWPQLLHNVL